MIKQLFKLGLLGLLLAVTTVRAESTEPAFDKLETFLHETHSIKSRFQQKLLDADGMLLQQSAGEFFLKKPGKFLWDYVLPYPQKIVSNGIKIWLYDSELEQVTVKKYDQVLSGAPVILLGRNGGSLVKEFDSEEMGSKDGYDWVKLIPRSQEKEFNEIQVGLQQGKLKIMRLKDAFNQTTILEFENPQYNVQLDDRMFEFKPPANADVVGDF